MTSTFAAAIFLSNLLVPVAQIPLIDQVLSQIGPGQKTTIIHGAAPVTYMEDKPSLAHLISAVHTQIHIIPSDLSELTGDVSGVTFEFRPEGIFVFYEKYQSFMFHTLQRSGHSLLREDLTGGDIINWVLQKNQEKYNADTYAIITRNCQHFSFEMYQFLTSQTSRFKIVPAGVFLSCIGFEKIIFSILFFAVLPLTLVTTMVCGFVYCPRRQRKRREQTRNQPSASKTELAEDTPTMQSLLFPGAEFFSFWNGQEARAAFQSLLPSTVCPLSEEDDRTILSPQPQESRPL
ncbi:hypothetical protein BLNAU_10117 [Blattamonas nauphoetae]|uniref:PPPDE domain-containing protein n=1 Tax=Blattamonas nauphoetae TaxID=2049346 RepID=A0ABQ9XU20_9EUKA|nr:hypothetical protein BLNAU_10117 [Blattamonas nauphoetae]